MSWKLLLSEGREFNDKIAIFSKLVVAFLDIDIHEVLDWLPNDSVDDVDDILPRKTMTVFLVWKVVLHTRVLQPFFKERFNAKSFIERSEEDLDVSSLEIYRTYVSWQKHLHFF